MSTQEERLAIVAALHAGLAAANDALTALCDLIGVPPPSDPLTLTDTEIDTYIDMIDKEAKS